MIIIQKHLEVCGNIVNINKVSKVYCNIPAVDNKNTIVKFTDNSLTDSFHFKVKTTGQTGDDGTKNDEIMVPVKYLSNFWRTLEMPLINCEINLILT